MRRSPQLWPSISTPANEIDGVKNLSAYLTGIAASFDSWEAGLLLYQTAKKPPPTVIRAIASRWRFIACHECILVLFHLRARMEKIQSVQMRKCPCIRPFVEFEKLRSARKHLDEYFPDIEALRHAIAHSGENESHPEVHAPDEKYALTGFREPDIFSIHHQGKLRYLKMTTESLEQIDSVVEEYFEGFKYAAKELERQGHLD